MALYLAFLGLLRMIQSLVLFNLYQYGAELDTLGNVVSLILLTASSLSLPRWRRRTVEVRTAAPEVPDRSGHEMTCTCGKNLAEAQVGLPMDMEGGLCDACCWERKVAELANRRISVLQLLNFYERLGEKPDTVEVKAESMSHTTSEKLPTGKRIMPHFVPDVSTTNDVVRHAIIPESRTGDEGEALAEVLWRQARAPTGRHLSQHFSKFWMVVLIQFAILLYASKNLEFKFVLHDIMLSWFSYVQDSNSFSLSSGRPGLR